MKKQQSTAKKKPKKTIIPDAGQLHRDADGNLYLLGDLLLDRQDMLQTFRMSKRTLQYWRSEGIISYVEIVGKIYYLKKEAERVVMRFTKRCKRKKQGNA